jgi:hypothetical protein
MKGLDPPMHSAAVSPYDNNSAFDDTDTIVPLSPQQRAAVLAFQVHGLRFKAQAMADVLARVVARVPTIIVPRPLVIPPTVRDLITIVQINRQRQNPRSSFQPTSTSRVSIPTGVSSTRSASGSLTMSGHSIGETGDGIELGKT